MYKGTPVTNDSAIGPAEFAAAYKALSKKIRNQAHVVIVVENYDSPTLQYLVSRLQKTNPHVRLYRDDSFRSNHFEIALERLYEKPIRAKIHYSRASCIVSLDRDFLGIDPLGSATGFHVRRDPEIPSGMNRLYMAEGGYSLTGGMADSRLPLSPHKMKFALLELAHVIAEKTHFPPLVTFCAHNPRGEENNPQVREWIAECAEDLLKNKGQSLVLLGDRYAPEWHHAALVINAALGSFGDQAPISVYSSPYPIPPVWKEEWKDRHHGGWKNFDALLWLSPSVPNLYSHELSFLFDALKDKEHTYHLGLYPDKIARSFRWHIPVAHFLESWGDYLSPDGTLSLQQPITLPLHKGISPLEFLLGLVAGKGILASAGNSKGGVSPAYSAIKSLFFKRTQATDKELEWNLALKRGYHQPKQEKILDPVREIKRGEKLNDSIPSHCSLLNHWEKSICLSVVPDYSLWDGRYINNAWLHECPDPVSKIVWGNAALTSPSLFRRLTPDGDSNALLFCADTESSPFILLNKLCQNDSSPAYPPVAIPGMADDLIVIPLGYGQMETGIVGEGCGFPACLPADISIIRARLVTAPLESKSAPVFSQRESTLYNRSLIRSAPYKTELPPPQGKDKYHQWGMCIDLSKCIGCNACVLACQAENNIPLVGREQAANNRLMHWLHVDRYFQKTKSGATELLFQPRACQQCESAPCESVCPLNATTHTGDGLNAMTYARCVGTRYCANNCPYKVRRFNYFDYNKYNPFLPGNLMKGKAGESIEATSLRLQRNPNVSVRIRGVMEKCTYCVQRIEAAKVRKKQRLEQIRQESGIPSPQISLTDDDMRIPAESFQCACQAACPAGAITFGNLLDGEQAAVGRARSSSRAYTLLRSMGTRPRTAYLTRVRNPRNDE